MAISTYSEVKTAVANWLNRSDLTTYIPDFVTFAEVRIYRELKVRQMETALSSAISSGTIAVPSGFTSLKYAYVDGSPTRRLEPATPQQIYEQYPTRSADAKPRHIAREGATFIFGPYPDSGYTIKGIYYKKLDALSDSNTTNWLTSDAPDLLVFAALCEAEPFIKNDPRLALWEGKYQVQKTLLESQDQNDMGSGMRMRSA